MAHRWCCATLVLTLTTLAGCGATTSPDGEARSLTEIELDHILASSSAALSSADAFAIGSIAQSSVSTSTFVGSVNTVPPSSAFGTLPLLNYATAQSSASGNEAMDNQAFGSVRIGVDGRGGGASIAAGGNAAALGSAAGQAQINMNFYGVSIGQVDLAFGTATAAGCCAPLLRADVSADGVGGGYWRQVEAFTRSAGPSQVQSRVDIAVISSALPMLDAGQVSALLPATLSQSLSQ